LQKLKRSLSFKTKSLRSKSADNFFQRTNSDVKLQADMLSEVSPSSSLLPSPGCLTSTVTRAGLYPGGGKAHAFQEHIFKKPTFCDVCNHMIVGKLSLCLLLQVPASLESQEGCLGALGVTVCVNRYEAEQSLECLDSHREGNRCERQAFPTWGPNARPTPYLLLTYGLDAAVLGLAVKASGKNTLRSRA
ncbi:SH3 and cysteine-rich domain-containing protein, partial [Eschrichtius robustus]|nr:SH3 and cysteine-rich domain-containing protein [Eschrichtius robustus]